MKQRRPERVLIVDDERALVGLLAKFLGESGYEVTLAYSAEGALRSLRSEAPDLVLLDLGLPGMSGEELYRLISQDADVPVIIVTARRDPRETARFLEMGAEDYLTKPFAREELVGRVRAVLRRAGPRTGTTQVDGIIVDARRHEALVRGRRLALTPIEFNLLARLATGRLVPARDLLRAGWRDAAEVHPDVLRGPLYRLRAKLDATESGLALESVRGVGYRLARRDRPNGTSAVDRPEVRARVSR